MSASYLLNLTVVGVGKSQLWTELVRYTYPSLSSRAILSHLRSIAGLGAGMTEAVFAVTPSETIKSVKPSLCS